MRILSGIKFRRAEIIIFEPNKTNVAAIPMPMAFTTVVETASVGQSPKTKANVGLSMVIPFLNSCHKFLIV
jgi:hypothetical protein